MAAARNVEGVVSDQFANVATCWVGNNIVGFVDY